MNRYWVKIYVWCKYYKDCSVHNINRNKSAVSKKVKDKARIGRNKYRAGYSS